MGDDGHVLADLRVLGELAHLLDHDLRAVLDETGHSDPENVAQLRLSLEHPTDALLEHPVVPRSPSSVEQGIRLRASRARKSVPLPDLVAIVNKMAALGVVEDRRTVRAGTVPVVARTNRQLGVIRPTCYTFCAIGVVGIALFPGLLLGVDPFDGSRLQLYDIVLFSSMMLYLRQTVKRNSRSCRRYPSSLDFPH